MSLFSLRKNAERIGTIIDIGSGSVLVAIIVSKNSTSEPTIVWSHREHSPLRNIDSIDQSAKSVLTALVNALLKFDGEGRRALYEYNKARKIPEVQCCISAPWSYTVTKSINYLQDAEFNITKNLIDELIRTAEQKITEELKESESAASLGLTVITRRTMDILANGYRIEDPFNQKAKEISLSHASVVTQNYLVKELEQLQEKIFPSSVFHKLSHILAFYSVSGDLLPTNFDTCLVDITYEATEIGIVRDGSLRYATHIPFGSFSLAREISAITSVPLYEAFQNLHTENPYQFLESLPQSQRDDVEKVFEAYTQRLADLFRETGDDLSIPKQILVHADMKSEPLFVTFIERAARRVLKSEANIIMTTPAILKKSFPSFLKNSERNDVNVDTGMLLSALFFHKQNPDASFEYL
jgi:cell division ATPase FtsA